jgi:hypothetical protein
MSEAPAAKPTPPSHTSLAELLYVELIGRAFLRVENNAVIKPEPAQLARLSIVLATEFEKAATEHRAASGPKNVGYDVQNLDLGSLGA